MAASGKEGTGNVYTVSGPLSSDISADLDCFFKITHFGNWSAGIYFSATVI